LCEGFEIALNSSLQFDAVVIPSVSELVPDDFASRLARTLHIWQPVQPKGRISNPSTHAPDDLKPLLGLKI